MARDLKSDWEATVKNTSEFIKDNKLLTGIVLGGTAGTFLLPIPVVGTIVGAFLGAHVAGRMEAEEKMDDNKKANEKLKRMGSLSKSYCDTPTANLGDGESL